MNEACYICGDSRKQVLETHHIVPKRFGGSDDEENLVRLCASCHQAIEHLYDERFYEKLGVEKDSKGGEGSPEFLDSPADLTKGGLYVCYVNNEERLVLRYKRKTRSGTSDSHIFFNALKPDNPFDIDHSEKEMWSIIENNAMAEVNWDVRPQDTVEKESGSFVILEPEYDPYSTARTH